MLKSVINIFPFFMSHFTCSRVSEWAKWKSLLTLISHFLKMLSRMWIHIKKEQFWDFPDSLGSSNIKNYVQMILKKHKVVPKNQVEKYISRTLDAPVLCCRPELGRYIVHRSVKRLTRAVVYIPYTLIMHGRNISIKMTPLPVNQQM